MPTVTYVGTVDDSLPNLHGWHVVMRVDGVERDLPHVGPRVRPRGEMQFHSEHFAWGYEGSGPADLALAILAREGKDRTWDLRKVWSMHQDFKRDVITRLPYGEGWTLSDLAVRDWIKQWRQKARNEEKYLR